MNTKVKELRPGNIVKFQKGVFRVEGISHNTPGRRAATTHIEFKKIPTGEKEEKTFKSEEVVESISLLHKHASFSYSSDDLYTFIDLDEMDTIEINKEKIAHHEMLMENMVVNILYIEDVKIDILGVELPFEAVFDVISSPAVIKGQSEAPQSKKVKLSNGIEIKAPQYIKEGDKVKVNLATRTFIERVQ